MGIVRPYLSIREVSEDTVVFSTEVIGHDTKVLVSVYSKQTLADRHSHLKTVLDVVDIRCK